MAVLRIKTSSASAIYLYMAYIWYRDHHELIIVQGYHSLYTPNQWEMALQCNVTSHLLGNDTCFCLIPFKARGVLYQYHTHEGQTQFNIKCYENDLHLFIITALPSIFHHIFLHQSSTYLFIRFTVMFSVGKWVVWDWLCSTHWPWEKNYLGKNKWGFNSMIFEVILWLLYLKTISKLKNPEHVISNDSTLVKEMACFGTSYYLNQYWLRFVKCKWHHQTTMS